MSTRTYHARKAAGMCWRCGVAKVSRAGRAGRCDQCADAREVIERGRIAAGLCPKDGRPSDHGTLECQVCRARASTRRAVKRAAGVCIQTGCENPAARASVKCAPCQKADSDHYLSMVAARRCTQCPGAASPGRTRCKRCRTRATGYIQAKSARLRQQALAGYGSACQCCGETHSRFLTLDHVGGGGNLHREKVRGGIEMYNWVILNGFPKSIQILCMNCQWGQMNGAICPHQAEKKHPEGDQPNLFGGVHG